MSEIVNKFPGSARAKYDWGKWMDGEIHRCRKGHDFETDPQAFSMAARKYASRHGLKCEAQVKGNNVYVKFIDPEAAPAPAKKTTAKKLRKVSSK